MKNIIEIRERVDMYLETYLDIIFFNNNGYMTLVSSIPKKYIDNELLEILKIIQEDEIDQDKLDKIADVFSKYSYKKVGA